MIGNWKATAWLSSPLAGDPPALDALLEWELSHRLGVKHRQKLTRDVKLSDIKRVPIPLSMVTIADRELYRCSDPIIPKPFAEWSDHSAKRFDTDLAAHVLAPDQQKNIIVTSGPYKMRFVPVRVRLVDRVVWFFRGDRYEVRRLLKSVYALGKHRATGYGLVERWDFEEVEEDYSIVAECEGRKVLMKTIPSGPHLAAITGYKPSFGGAFPPYWHPETSMEIAVPC